MSLRETALHFAARNDSNMEGMDEIIKLLLEKGAKGNAKNKFG